MPTSALDSFALPRHGGDLAAAERRFGRPSEGWLDLSTGINPFAYVPTTLAEEIWRQPPGQAARKALIGAAARHFRAPGVDSIAALAGTAFRVLPRLRPFSRVSVIAPTSSFHAEAWTRAGHQVAACETLERIGDAEVVIVVNPNTPDGRRHDPVRLLDLAGEMALRNGLLVVDEAYGDVAPDLTVAPAAGPGLMVLKSFGPFFGLAGLGLRFAIAEPSLVRLLREVVGEASGPALAVARAAFEDEDWITAMRTRLAAEAITLDRMLAQYHLSIAGGTTLFRLVSAPRAWALYEHLGQRGILVRPFAAAPRWVRFGLPKSPEERKRLAEALAAWEA